MSHDHNDPHDTVEDFEHDLEAHDEWFRHGPDEPQHQEMHGQTNPYAIMAFLIGTVVLVLVTGGLIFHLIFLKRTNELQEQVVEKRTDSTWLAASNELKANWQNELNNAGWVDKNNGVVRLPLDTAIDLVVDEYAEEPAGR